MTTMPFRGKSVQRAGGDSWSKTPADAKNGPKAEWRLRSGVFSKLSRVLIGYNARPCMINA